MKIILKAYLKLQVFQIKKKIKAFSGYNNLKIKNMHKIFNGCKSLLYLPDLSKWNTSNVVDNNFT